MPNGINEIKVSSPNKQCFCSLNKKGNLNLSTLRVAFKNAEGLIFHDNSNIPHILNIEDGEIILNSTITEYTFVSERGRERDT